VNEGAETDLPCWHNNRFNEKTQPPQFRPAPVAPHTCATVRAPSAMLSRTSRSLTTSQWQTITEVRLP